VLANLHRLKLQLFKLPRSRRSARLVLFFLLLIAPFAVIHDSADRRPRGGRNLNQIQPKELGSDPLWNHASGTWARDMGILAGLAVIFALLAYLRLRRLSPGRRR